MSVEHTDIRVDALLRRFQAQIRSRPDAVALVAGEIRVTYAELGRRAERVRALLATAGVRSGELVGVRLPRGDDVAVAILGVLGHGCGYLPIDPAYPVARQDYLVHDSGIRHVLEHGPAQTGADAETRAGTVLVLTPVPGSPPGGRTLPDGTAYVIYTSGSTGRPKGVPVTQRQVAALMTAAEELFDFGPEDRWSLVHSHSFDFSVWEMWGAWWHGGSAVVVPVECTYDAALLADLLAAQKITVLNQVPSMFGQLVNRMDGSGRSLPELRHIVFGGEAVNLADVRRWRDAGCAPRARLANMYGITETTVHVTYRSLDGDLPPGPPGTTPIGRPLAHLGVLLLDDELRPVPPGTPGQLAVHGAGVGQGYLGRPGQTAERFVSLPGVSGPVYLSGDWAVEDEWNDLHYIGRKDDQIQLRGLRIERGEVAAAVLSHPDVAACAVTAPPNPVGDPVLVAHFVPRSEPGPSTSELRRHVADLLPRAMVPARFAKHRELPLTAHGKVDLAALDERRPAAGSARP
jgi:amino acid adenylation domain-containing protein